jgi:hypothetical protein
LSQFHPDVDVDPHLTPRRAVFTGSRGARCGDPDGTRSRPIGNHRVDAVPVVRLVIVAYALGGRKSLQPKIVLPAIVTGSGNWHSDVPPVGQIIDDRILFGPWGNPHFTCPMTFMIVLMYIGGFLR